MPLDGTFSVDQMTAAMKLRRLADFMETLEPGQVDLRTVHHPCGAAHCAWGWGGMIGLFPRSEDPEEGADEENDAGWADEMFSAEEGRSNILGLTFEQFRYCFGMGYQFRSLGRPYTPADVAGHLRSTATAIEADKRQT